MGLESSHLTGISDFNRLFYQRCDLKMTFFFKKVSWCLIQIGQGRWTFCLGALNNCPWMRYSELFDLLVDYLNNAWKWNRKLNSDLHSEACFIYILRTWTINFTIYLFLAPNYYGAFSHVHFNDFLKLLKFLRFWNIKGIRCRKESDPLYVGSVSFRHWFQNGLKRFGLPLSPFE